MEHDADQIKMKKSKLGGRPSLVSFLTQVPHQRKIKLAALLFLSCLAVAEVYVFSGSFNGFFFGDSLRVISARPKTLRELLSCFTGPNPVGVYRPISQSLSAYLLIPLFKTNFSGYHVVSLATHILNSVVVFLFLKKFYERNLLAFIGAFFFGVHPSNFYATYDMGFYPDIFYLLFYVLGLLAVIHYVKNGHRGCYILALGMFVLSLMCKEAAITFPVLVFLYLLLFGNGLWRSVKLSLPFAGILLLYLALYALNFEIVNGKLIPKSNPGHTFHFGFNILENYVDLIYWSFRIPKDWPTDGWSADYRYINYLFAMLISAVTLYGLLRKDPRIIFGVLLFILALAPIAPCEGGTIPHYLYLGLVGLSLLVAGLFAAIEKVLLTKRAALAFYILVVLFCYYNIVSARKNVRGDLEYSWVGLSSRVARNAALFLRDNERKIRESKSIYILGDPNGATGYHLLGGTLFSFLTQAEHLNARVVSDHEDVPANVPEGVYVFKCVNTHFYDVTSQYRTLQKTELALDYNQRGQDLLEAFIKGQCQVIAHDTSDFSDTGGKPAFLMDILREETRNALVTLAGRKVTFPVTLSNDAYLDFGIALAYDSSDGAEAQISFEKDGKAAVLFSEHLHPLKRASDRRWHDYTIDLSRFKGESGRLSFECLPGPMGDASGDWLGWSKIIIRSR